MKFFTFITPIPYGDKSLSEITLRRPMAGDLRGVKLIRLHEMDVDALNAIVPRIANPPVTPGQLAHMDAHDTVRLMEAVTDFFNSAPGARTEAPSSPTTPSAPGA